MELTWFARAVVYSRTRLLRALRLLPAVLAVSLALVLLLGLFAASALSGYRLGTDQQGVRLGFVTEGEDHYVELGLRTLETMDQARFAIIPVRCTEAEAADLLRRGEISAYLVAPEGFSEALMAGENRPLRFVYGDGAVDLGSMLMDELVQTAGKLLLETENAVFGAQEYAAEHIPGQNPSDLLRGLCGRNRRPDRRRNGRTGQLRLVRSRHSRGLQSDHRGPRRQHPG